LRAFEPLFVHHTRTKHGVSLFLSSSLGSLISHSHCFVVVDETIRERASPRLTSKMSSPDFHCKACHRGLTKDRAAVLPTADDFVVGITCSCNCINWCCHICANNWRHRNNNSRHMGGDEHQNNVAAQVNSAMARATLSDQAAEDDQIFLPGGSFGEGSGGEDPFGDDPGGDTCCASPSPTGDWLVALPGQLGGPAVTLEAMRKGGSFAETSKSPEHCHCEAQNPGQGAKHLAAKPFDVAPEELGDDESMFHLKMTRFLKGQTQQQQEELAHFLLQVHSARSQNGLSIFHKTRPPLSTEDFRDFCLGGSKSITKNLPTPVVRKTPDQLHSYVSLTDATQNMLAASVQVDQFQFEAELSPSEADGDSEFFDGDEPATSISTTRAAFSLCLELKKDRRGGFVLHLWTRRWSDDFDPNNTKQSRNQVWLAAHTVCPPAGEKKGRNTFFMAVGQKGDDHQEIEELFESELAVLAGEGRTLHHGGRKEFIHVKAGKVGVCVDRPERASLHQIGDHSGTHSACWGHAVAVDGKAKDNCLPSCPFCRRKKLEDHMSAVPEGQSQCEDECVSWNVMDSRFAFVAPADCPKTCDQSPEAPLPPLGRETDINSSSVPRLRTTFPDVEWLGQAAAFAHHNLKSRPPGARGRKRFWTKAGATACLRTCGTGTKLTDTICESAQRADVHPPLPCTWKSGSALRLTHCAVMHMLFLGHAKSNCDMTNKAVSEHNTMATFGKQANKHLRDVQALRCNCFFDAQPLSTSSWGTGVWVSENCVFWARTPNFFFALPAISAHKKTGTNPFDADMRMLGRFASSGLAAIGRAMSDKRVVADMDQAIKTCLDSMVEVDRWMKEAAANPQDDAQTDDEEDEEEEPTVRAAQSANDHQPTTRKRKGKSQDKCNFCKSNSLGTLSAAKAHRCLGPAFLWWEGGWAGERKIQNAKPQLGIKRATADWRTLVLQCLWQRDMLSALMRQLDGTCEDDDSKREMEGMLRVCANRSAALEAVDNNMPLSAMLANDGTIWIAHRPSTSECLDDETKPTSVGWSRSAVQLQELKFHDGLGKCVSDLCWFAPVNVGRVFSLGSTSDVREFANQHLLLLPQLGPNDECQNSHCGIGSKWSQRNSRCVFGSPQISTKVFEDWTVA